MGQQAQPKKSATGSGKKRASRSGSRSRRSGGRSASRGRGSRSRSRGRSTNTPEVAILKSSPDQADSPKANVSPYDAKPSANGVLTRRTLRSNSSLESEKKIDTPTNQRTATPLPVSTQTQQNGDVKPSAEGKVAWGGRTRCVPLFVFLACVVIVLGSLAYCKREALTAVLGDLRTTVMKGSSAVVEEGPSTT